MLVGNVLPFVIFAVLDVSCASQISRCFLSVDYSILCKAFAVYVRPMSEYCSPVWSPYFASSTNKLEFVQRSVTKRLTGLRSLYNELYLD